MGALACGIGLGGAVITLAQIAVALLADVLAPAVYREAIPDPLLVGLFAGIVVASVFGWRRSRPLANPWQSGVIGVLSAVGALLVGFLAAVVHRFLGLGGLVAWALLAVTVGVAASRWAIRGSGEQGPLPHG